MDSITEIQSFEDLILIIAGFGNIIFKFYFDKPIILDYKSDRGLTISVMIYLLFHFVISFLFSIVL